VSAFLHSKESGQDYHAFLFVFLIGIGARLFFLIYLDEPPLFAKYPFFAEKLAEGKDIGERLVDLSPFYLYLMTALKKVFDVDWTYVKFIQSFVGTLNCLLVFAVGRRVFRQEVGFLAGLMYALYGNLIILESTLEPTVFVLSFNLLAVYGLVRCREDGVPPGRAWVWPLLAGFFVGLSIITKPNFLLFLPVGAVWLLVSVGQTVGFQRRLANTLCFFAVVLLVVIPVTVRNYVRLHDFVLVTADAGKVFFHGNGRGATALEGTGLPDEGFAEEGADEPDYAHVLYRKTASNLSGRALSPSESSKFWIRRARDDIVIDPIAYMKLELKKLFYFFNDYEMHYIASAYKEYKASLAFPFIRYGVIASLGLLGMLLAFKNFKTHALLYAVVFLYLLSGMLFLVQSRYRTPAVPYLCLFAGHAIYALRKMVAAKRFRAVAAALILIGMLFFLTRFFYTDEIVKVDQWQQATKIHYEMDGQWLFKSGKYREAIAELDQCIAIEPGFGPAYNLRGKGYAVLGRYDEALRDFNKVMSLTPNLAHGYKNAGFLYLLEGDFSKAKSYLVKALSLAPHDSRVQEALAKLN
jgi:4-amino-4-deoxy-L-arabinose transferase-like glycosyltransferase